MTPEERRRVSQDAIRTRVLVVASIALVLVGGVVLGRFFALQPTPGAIILAVTMEPLPTNTPRATATAYPTVAPTITPVPTPTIQPCPGTPGDVCKQAEPTWTPIPTLTPIPTYPGEELATPGARYVMPEGD